MKTRAGERWAARSHSGRRSPAPGARFLGRDDGGELAPSNVSHELPCGRVQIADDPVAIDYLGRNTDPLDRVFDLAADGLELGHAFESAPPTAAAQLRSFPSEMSPTDPRFTFLKGL